jgi:hypothetical protein
VPLPGEIGGEPGEEEDEGGVAAELADAGAPDLAVAEEAAKLRPVDGRGLAGDRGFGIAVEHPPDGGEGDAGGADGEEKPSPAEGAGDPKEQRAETGEAEIFADGVDGSGLRALVLAEPGGDDALTPSPRRKAMSDTTPVAKPWTRVNSDQKETARK